MGPHSDQAPVIAGFPQSLPFPIALYSIYFITRLTFGDLEFVTLF